MPEGAFYAFPGVEGLFGPLVSLPSNETAMLFLREAHVVTVPGEGSAAPGMSVSPTRRPVGVSRRPCAGFAEFVPRRQLE